MGLSSTLFWGAIGTRIPPETNRDKENKYPGIAYGYRYDYRQDKIWLYAWQAFDDGIELPLVEIIARHVENGVVSDDGQTGEYVIEQAGFCGRVYKLSEQESGEESHLNAFSAIRRYVDHTRPEPTDYIPQMLKLELKLAGGKVEYSETDLFGTCGLPSDKIESEIIRYNQGSQSALLDVIVSPDSNFITITARSQKVLESPDNIVDDGDIVEKRELIVALRRRHNGRFEIVESELRGSAFPIDSREKAHRILEIFGRMRARVLLAEGKKELIQFHHYVDLERLLPPSVAKSAEVAPPSVRSEKTEEKLPPNAEKTPKKSTSSTAKKITKPIKNSQQLALTNRFEQACEAGFKRLVKLIDTSAQHKKKAPSSDNDKALAPKKDGKNGKK
ncbi:MAG: hypothetical protein ACOYK8_10245 [Alphaproteobacteria bacterium]